MQKIKNFVVSVLQVIFVLKQFNRGELDRRDSSTQRGNKKQAYSAQRNFYWGTLKGRGHLGD